MTACQIYPAIHTTYDSVVDISNNKAKPLNTLLKFCGIVWTQSPFRQSHNSLDVGSLPAPHVLASQFASHVAVNSPTSLGYVMKSNSSSVSDDPVHL